jgi:hypothetical protein
MVQECNSPHVGVFAYVKDFLDIRSAFDKILVLVSAFLDIFERYAHAVSLLKEYFTNSAIMTSAQIEFPSASIARWSDALPQDLP